MRVFRPDPARDVYTGHALNRESGELLTFQFEGSPPSVMPARRLALGPVGFFPIVIAVIWAIVCTAGVIAELIRNCEEAAKDACGEAGVKSVHTRIKVGVLGCTADCEHECQSQPGPEVPQPEYEGNFPDAD